LQPINRPALGRRGKVDQEDIRAQGDTVLPLVLSPVAGAVHRAAILLAPHIEAVAGDPAVQRVEEFDRPSVGRCWHQGESAPTCSAIMRDVYFNGLALRTECVGRQEAIRRAEEEGQEGHDPHGLRREGNGLVPPRHPCIVGDIEPGEMIASTTADPAGGLVHEAESSFVAIERKREGIVDRGLVGDRKELPACSAVAGVQDVHGLDATPATFTEQDPAQLSVEKEELAISAAPTWYRDLSLLPGLASIMGAVDQHAGAHPY